MNLFHMLDQDDPFTLFCLIAITAIVGSNMACNPNVRQWGRRGAGGAYAIFFIYSCFILQPSCASDFSHIAFRSLFAAGLALTCGWIVFSIVAFIATYTKTHFRPMYRPPVISEPAKQPPQIRTVYVQPTNAQKMQDFLNAYETERRLLQGLPDDEKPIAEDALRMKYLKMCPHLKV